MKKLLSITASILFIASCGGGSGGGNTPTPTTPTPIVNLSADPVSVLLGSTSTLTWSSTNATSCSASWTTQTSSSGSEVVTISTAGNNSFSISCTGAGGSRSASITVEGYRNTDGVVVDGYISGAEVCIDEDESWTCDTNESSTTSDNDGKFTIKYANGNLVSIGGTDLDSQALLDNLLITHKLTGHSDFKAVTPVTSVAAFMTDTSLVNVALGIDSSIDISTFDPVANKGDGGVNDYLYEKGNQLTILAYALQNITNNLNTTTETTQDYFKAITEEIEKEYIETTTKVDIETEAFVTKVLDNIVKAKTVTITDEAKANTTKALSGVMPVIEVKTSDNLTTSVIRFAVSTLQTDIQAIANGTASVETVASYTNDVITYIAEDQNIEADKITPDITAIADSATTSEDTSVTINVVLNDSYLTSAPISVSAGNGSNGTTTLAESSPEQIVYTPNADYNGTDTFSYTITQGDKTSSADVTVTIGVVNDPPSIDTASTIQVAENQTAITTVSISDVDDDDLILTLGGTDADSFNLSPDNVLTFKEAPDFETKSSYSITLSLTDGIEAVDKDISIVITDVNEFGIDGRAAKGVIGGATITVVDSAGADVAIASGGTTGADGSYTIIFDQAEVSAPIVVMVVGGDGATMVCDIDLAGTDDDCAVGDGTSVAFGESYPLPRTFALRGLVAEIPTEDGASATVNITPASDLATNLALVSADTNALTAADVEAASSQVLGLIQTITGTDLSGLDINDIAIPDVADSADAAAASESSLALAAFSAAIIANQGDGETVSDVIDRVNATLSANSEGDLMASGTELSSLTNSVITALITVSDQVIAGGGDSSVVDQAIANAEAIEEVYEAIGSEDISIPSIDNIAPVIKVNGDNPVTIELGSIYIDAGATANGGEIVITSGTIPYISGTFVTSTVGSYTLTYSATDMDGNTGTTTRAVNIVDTTAPQITSNPNFTADENQSEIGEVLAFDLSPVITFTVSGSELAITSAGVLTFASAPDYETKSTYTATVTATDGTNPTTQNITVNVTDVDEIGSTPVITSPNTFNANENQTAIGTVTATDADDDEVTFTVSGSELAITSAGVLTFASVPDYETKSTYTATVTATDGTNPTTQSITVNVTDVNDNTPVFTSGATFSAAENQTAIGTVTATDADDDEVTFTVSGSELAITSAGVLTFASAPDYETKSTYTATVTATDGTNPTTQNITVNVTDVDEIGSTPVITSPNTFNANENQTAIGTVTATDADDDEVTFTVSGSELAITSAGVLTFASVPDYETKSTYTATVTATDGTNPTTQSITVNVTDVNDNTPVFTSGATFSAAENQTAIGTVTATDADDDEVTFTVSGSELAITSAGVLTFASVPDYETKSTYTATVTATDGTNPTTQNITVNVTDVNEAPIITNFANILNTEENQVNVYQVNAQDYEGDSIYYSISGTDKSFFNISSSGLVTFKTAPDYENPLDSGFNNSYSINIEVSDGQLSQNNIQPSSNDGFAPENGSFSPELKTEQTSNSTEIVIANVDEDLIDLVLYSSDGTTSSSPTLSIDLKIDELTRASEVHVLTWLKDNSQTWYYASKNDSLNWSINEILNKYAPAGTYEIRQVLIKRNGLSDLTIVDTALKEKGFDIDTDIANANSDNTDPLLKGIDSITVSGNDGNSETNIVVTIVASVEDIGSGVEKAFSYIKAPGGDITGSYAVLNDSKNKATFTFILDSRAASGTYSIDDIRITDSAGNEKFFYNTDISEAGFTSSLVINNNIADDLAPNITELNLTSSINTSDLNRKQITVDLTIDEQVTDIKRIYIRLISPDGANIDSDSFTAVGLQVENKYSNTISLPLEYPDGTYNVSYIFLSDAALNQKSYSAYELSELGFDTSVVFGEVTNSNTPPVFTSNSSFTVEENQTSAADITVTDADSDSISFSLSGTDADSFAISSSGVLTFNNAPDYETKESYSLIITASDGSSSVSQTINISITNVNEVPQISALSSTQTPDENQVSVVTVSASDPDALTTLTYTLSGTDSSLFAISSSGVLTFISAPDYEVPGGAEGDNNYQINVVVSDGSLSVTQAITIQVQNVADLISGVAVDGYVAGATVFQDLNNDGDLDSGEPSAATNSLGSFSLNLSSVNINAPVRIYNGFDLTSNEVHPSIMDISVSETGSYIVTPISTLVGRLKIEDTSLIAMVPQSMIAGALGISLADSPNDSILGFDPIAYFNGSDATLASEARPVFAASQLLMTMGGGNYSVHKYITDQVLSTLSSTLTTAAESSITLSSANDILGLKQDAYDAIFNGYVDTTLANNPPINNIQFRNNKAVMTDYLNGSSSSAVNYSLYGVHDGTTTLVADLVGAKLDYDNLKQILDNDGTGTPMDLNFELANIPAAGSGSTGVTLKLFYGDDTTQDADEDYLQIALTANWESDGTNFKIKLPANSAITASFYDRGGTILSITPTNQVEDIFTVTKDGPNRPATLSLRLSKLFNAFPTEVTGLSSFLDGAAEFTYLVEFDNFTIYDHLDNTFTKIQGTFEVDADPGITVFADDIYVHENATSKDISFYLSQAASSDVTLDYAIADASTASSSDYTLSSGTVTIPAGSMSATLTIPVTNDTTVEALEEIRLTLSNVQNAVLGRTSVSAFITDGEEILANSTQKAILADNIFKDSKASINAYIKNKLDTLTITISGTSYTYSQVLINNSVTTDVYAYLDSIIDDYEVLSETLLSLIMTKADAYIDAQLSSFADYTAFGTALTQLNSGIKGLNMSQIVGTNINSNGSFPSGQNATTLQTALDGTVDTLVTLAADTVADILGTDTNTNFPNANVVMGTDGDDTITGTSGSDLIASFGGTDTVNALAGNDKILGGSGVDTLNGGDGNDHLYGYAGADTLNGNAGDDLIYGGKDNDSINGGAGDDDLRGEAGDDTIITGAGSDTVSGGLGDDTIIIDAI